jgi:hypothetical protein
MLVHLYSAQNKGRSPATKWGRVAFDAAGYATLDVPEDAIDQLKAVGWYMDPQPGSSTPGKPEDTVIADTPKSVVVGDEFTATPSEEKFAEEKPEEKKHHFTGVKQKGKH